jgi:mannan polymerase II complex MNN10 subunit
MRFSNKLNTGSMIIRGTASALVTLEAVIAYGEEHTAITEQDAFRQVINEKGMSQYPFSQTSRVEGGDKAAKKAVVMIPQYKINAYPEEIGCLDEHKRTWQPGMFVMHFAGAWAHIKEKDAYGWMMRKYEGSVVWE